MYPEFADDFTLVHRFVKLKIFRGKAKSYNYYTKYKETFAALLFSI